MECKVYKGYRISFNESTGKWELYSGKGEDLYSNESYNKVKEYIDRFRRKNHVRVSILSKNGRWGERTWIPAVVTSYNPDNNECWVSDSKGEREKLRLRWSNNLIVKDTPDNRVKAAEVAVLDKQKVDLDQKIEQLEESMEKWNSDDLRKAVLGEDGDGVTGKKGS